MIQLNINSESKHELDILRVYKVKVDKLIDN